MQLPFTAAQFFDVFATYNTMFGTVAVGLWLYSAGAAVLLEQRRVSAGFFAILLALQWAWAGTAYHWFLFTRINPAAWLFGAMFVVQAGLLVRLVARRRIPALDHGHWRTAAGWALIVYALLYPAAAIADGHAYPAVPTFGLPCPTALLTFGFLLVVESPLPRSLVVIPMAWAALAGSAALLLSVHVDLMLWVGALLVWERLHAERSAVPLRRALTRSA